jgi:hypothetical protein
MTCPTCEIAKTIEAQVVDKNCDDCIARLVSHVPIIQTLSLLRALCRDEKHIEVIKAKLAR